MEEYGIIFTFNTVGTFFGPLQEELSKTLLNNTKLSFVLVKILFYLSINDDDFDQTKTNPIQNLDPIHFTPPTFM